MDFLDITGNCPQTNRKPRSLPHKKRRASGTENTFLLEWMKDLSGDLQIARLISEVIRLTASVRELLNTPTSGQRTWIQPRELAALLGVSVRTIGNWRQAGRFNPGSFRPSVKGFQYHATRALADAQRLEA